MVVVMVIVGLAGREAGVMYRRYMYKSCTKEKWKGRIRK